MPRMSWNDILSLQQDGQEIESKGMTHRDINLLAPNDLEFEIGGSKQCLENHGINSPNIFAVVHGDAWANPAVINTISKYYGFADNGFADLLFLYCDGYVAHKQLDCRTYDDRRTLTYANRYSIREDSHNSWDQNYLHNDSVIFQKFIELIHKLLIIIRRAL
ncbi:MAG: polysaccharide deacetylase family protein [Nitrososphaeraceae archaeon]